MRTDTKVGGKDALTVVLGDLSGCSMRAEMGDIIVNQGYGEKNVAKDFLIEGCNDTEVRRGVNSRKRKCVAIFLSKLDKERVEQLKRGK